MSRVIVCAGVLLLHVGAVIGQEAAPDYAKQEAWLCHPNNKSDSCDQDLNVTVIAADGKFTSKPFKEAKDQAIDCFYVYPTTSLDQSMTSDLNPGKDEELITAYVQAARFRSQCRVFAPMYRQNTVTSLRAAAAGKPMSGDRSVIYADVLNAWNYYLQKENKGRGVVLIGHSQGASLLTRLIAAEIDGKPVQKHLVSAFLIGSAVGEISLNHKPYLPWTTPEKKVPTPFVLLPGFLQGECVQRGEFSYLEITLNSDPKDARTDDLIGDVLTADGGINTGWGLHLIDMSLTMGNLLTIVEKQAKAYAKQ